MKQNKISLLLLLFSYLLLANPAEAACPGEINDNDVDVIAGNTCVIPAGTTYILDKVSSEASTTSGAELRLNGGSLTIFNTATLRTGILKPAGGNVIIQNGGTILIGGTTGTGLWVADVDADGYAANFTTYTATAAGRRRLGLMKSKTITDCNDNSSSLWQSLTGYLDADSDTYGRATSSQVCSGASLPNGYVANNLDCDDTNASIRLIIATGGTISNITGYKVHRFTSSGTFNITCGGKAIEYLVVAGGGGGAQAGGGGRGGQVRTGSLNLTAGAHTVTVGGGGASGGGTGGSSVFSSITSSGGYYPSGYGDTLSPPAGGTYSSITGASVLYGIFGASATAYGGGWNCSMDNGGPYAGYGVTGVGNTGGGGSACD